MRRITVLLSVMVLVLGMTGAAAMADTTLWDEGDVIEESDPFDVEVSDEVLDVDIDISGPDELFTDETGTYTVTVTNDDESNVNLEDWALGLSVGDDIGSLHDVTITYAGEETDLADDNGTPGVQAELEEGVIYLLGSDDPTVAPGDTATAQFDVTFHEAGNYVGTAYVIDTSDE